MLREGFTIREQSKMNENLLRNKVSQLPEEMQQILYFKMAAFTIAADVLLAARSRNTHLG